MIAPFYRYRFLLLFVAVVISLSGSLCSAQDTARSKSQRGLEKGEVKWVSQWPEADQKRRNTGGLGEKFRLVLLGKKNLELTRPVSAITDMKGNVWILDQQNNSIFEVTNGIGKIPHFIEKRGYDLSSLVGICNFLPDEFLFTDSHLNKIFLVNTGRKTCTPLNDTMKLDKPTGIAYSAVHHEIWLIETGRHRVLVLSENGSLKRIIGSRGTERGMFNFPTHIWIDKKGYVYIVDAMNFRVQVFNDDGQVVSVFGSNGDGSGYFASPKGIATDSHGNIYVADALFHVVQIFDIAGRYLYTFGSQGHGTGEFWMPSGVFIDDNDKIYVSDCYNSRLQVFQFIAGGKQ